MVGGAQRRPDYLAGAARVLGSGSLAFQAGGILGVTRTAPGVYELALDNLSPDEHVVGVKPVGSTAVERNIGVEYVSDQVLRVRNTGRPQYDYFSAYFNSPGLSPWDGVGYATPDWTLYAQASGSLWFKSSLFGGTSGGSLPIMTKGPTPFGGNYTFALWGFANTIAVDIGTNGGPNFTRWELPAAFLTSDVWYHFAWTFAPGVFVAYLNGVDVTALGTFSNPIPGVFTASAANPLLFGGALFSGTTTDGLWVTQATLSLGQVYTPAEVAAMYNGGSPRDVVPIIGLPDVWAKLDNDFVNAGSLGGTGQVFDPAFYQLPGFSPDVPGAGIGFEDTDFFVRVLRVRTRQT